MTTNFKHFLEDLGECDPEDIELESRRSTKADESCNFCGGEKKWFPQGPWEIIDGETGFWICPDCAFGINPVFAGMAYASPPSPPPSRAQRFLWKLKYRLNRLVIRLGIVEEFPF